MRKSLLLLLLRHSDVPDHDSTIPRATHDSTFVQPDSTSCKISVTAQNFHGLLTLAIPHAHGTISTAGEQLGAIWRELTVSDWGNVSVVLLNSLKSMQGLLVPSFVQNHVGDSDTGT